MELFEKKIDSKKIFDGKIVKLFVDTVELPNGQLATREIVRHPGAVCVLPLTDDGEVIMVRQFRYPFNEVMLEIPAGKLEIGEDPYEAVLRELEVSCVTPSDNIFKVPKHKERRGFFEPINETPLSDSTKVRKNLTVDLEKDISALGNDADMGSTS